SRRRHTRSYGDWSSDVCSSDLGTIYSIVVQPDQKILVGGTFTTVGPFAHPNLARINPDGSVDTNFIAYASDPVRAIVLQSDGKRSEERRVGKECRYGWGRTQS